MAETDKSKEILGAGREILRTEGDIDGQLKERLKTLEKVSKAYEDINAKIKASEELGKDLKSLEFDIFKNLKEQVKLQADLNKLLETDQSIVNRVQKKRQDLGESLKQETQAQKALDKLKQDALLMDEQDLKIQRLKIASAQQGLDNIQAYISEQKDSISLEEAQVMALQEALELSQKTLISLKQRAAQEMLIAQRMGITGNMLKGSYNILNKLGLGSFMRLQEITQKLQIEAQNGASKWKIFGMALGETFASLGEALKDPVTILTGLYKLFEGVFRLAVQYQTKLFEAAKTLGIGVTQSKELYKNFQGIAWQNGQLAMTAKQLVDSYSKVNEQLGFMGPKNAEFLTFAAGIERRLGLGAQDMENMYLFAASTGKSVKDTYANIIASTKMQGMRLKMQMSEKQIMQAISKVSATVFNNFKGNVQQIALAVQKATKFGTTLDQINQAGMSMLDFESSISKEFEAQLLTGRNIDLSRARQFALTGSTEQLMGEITRQLGNQAQWNKMNVLQQQSLAEAMGMSKEAVDEMFRKQQLVGALGKEANADAVTQYNTLLAQGKSRSEIFQLMGQQAASDALAASVQDKMAATMERIRDTMGRMAQVVIPIAEAFANMLGNANSLKILLGASVISAGLIAYSAIRTANAKQKEMATQLQLNIIQAEGAAMALVGVQREAAMARIAAIRAGASATAGSGYLGPAALGVGVAVIGALMAYLASAGGGGSSGVSAAGISAPSSGISPSNSTAMNMSANQQDNGSRINPAANERPINLNVTAKMAVDPGVMVSSINQHTKYDSNKLMSS